MATSRSKIVGIKGCAVYKLVGGEPITSTPQVDNVTITLPEITFSTTDVGIMGTIAIPDMTSLDNMQLTINIPVDNPDAAPLLDVGYQSWKITYVVSNVNSQGEETLTPCSVYAAGFIAGIPNAPLSKGGDGMADVTMNLMQYKKLVNSSVEYDIDRSSATLKIRGVDYNNVSALY